MCEIDDIYVPTNCRRRRILALLLWKMFANVSKLPEPVAFYDLLDDSETSWSKKLGYGGVDVEKTSGLPPTL